MTCLHATFGRRPRGVSILALGLVMSVAGCDSLLEVSNPNNIAGDDILEISAAVGMVNGALSGVSDGYAQILTSYATLTDELEWVGSRDGFRQLDYGDMTDVFNEFVDAEFALVARGRWMADEAVRILTIHNDDGALNACAGKVPTKCDLARAHIYRSIAYIFIADMFDDFVFSDRDITAPAIGQANMGTLYDDAVASLTTALSITTGADAALTTVATALRARAHFNRALWGKIGTRPIDTSNNGLVSSADAVADATTALALMGGNASTYRFDLLYSSSTVNAIIGNWVNQRQEMRIGPAYATPAASGQTYTAVSLTDLINTTTVSPVLDATITAFSEGGDYPALTVVSAREMHLIIAEDALARSDNAAFTAAINNVRALDGLTPYSGQIPAVALLEHHRRTDLFLQGRRLADLYRFGSVSREWQSTSVAVVQPGTFFPITATECLANDKIPDACTP